MKRKGEQTTNVGLLIYRFCICISISLTMLGKRPAQFPFLISSFINIRMLFDTYAYKSIFMLTICIKLKDG